MRGCSASTPSCRRTSIGSSSNRLPNPLSTHKPCGSWLASDGIVSGDTYFSDEPLSLASQLPQGSQYIRIFMPKSA
ncbi:hypothetical protein EJA70_16345 [Pseudomonas sp. PB103]|nr:hypothetical protein EJA70_16345 [Pseudomonas sp. PB103]